MPYYFVLFGLLVLGSFVLGCFDDEKCDLLVDPSFSLGWCRFRESWRIVRARPTDVEVIPKSNIDMQSIFGKAIKYKKPLLKITASAGGASLVQSRKFLVPQAGDVSIEYNAFVEKDATPGYIRVETAGGVILGEHKFQYMSKGVWNEAVMKFRVAAPNQYVVIKIAIIPESGLWTAYFGYIHACYTAAGSMIKSANSDGNGFSAWTLTGKIYDDVESAFYKNYGSKYTPIKKIVHSADSRTHLTRYLSVTEGDCMTVKATISYSEKPPKLVLLIDGVETESTWRAKGSESLTFIAVFKVQESGKAKIVLQLPESPKSCDFFYIAPIEILKKDCPVAEYVQDVSTDMY